MTQGEANLSDYSSSICLYDNMIDVVLIWKLISKIVGIKNF